MVLKLFYLAFFSCGLVGAFSEDVEKTFKAARRENKPVLISFHAIWCPPCNELKEFVFESSSFLEKAKSFKLLSVDADSPQSWKIKDKYRVGGYPTVVFTDPKGEEVYRIVGFMEAADFLKVMGLIEKIRGKPLSKACQSSQADDLWRCARLCVERKDDACAKAAFAKLEKKLSPSDYRYREARGYEVAASSVELKRDGYERLLKEFPNGGRAIFWAEQYLDLFEAGKEPKPKTELVEAVLSNFRTMLGDNTLSESGWTRSDLYQVRAMLLQRLDQKEKAKKAWQEALKFLDDLKAALPKGTEARGLSLDRISCLRQMGELDKALSLTDEWRARSPEEFTFHFISGNILFEQKKFDQALFAARKAYEYSYGDNRLRTATLLVKIYGTIPDQKAAEKISVEARAGLQPKSELNVRTHRYLKSLDDALKAI